MSHSRRLHVAPCDDEQFRGFNESLYKASPCRAGNGPISMYACSIVLHNWRRSTCCTRKLYASITLQMFSRRPAQKDTHRI
eukprot:5515627-Pleurochrysis_carterae.AAC.1